ncbi:MAG: SDR family oxidoreductase [Chloroflexi bacterium]|jgi:NAD(P)-dependent dehydrogenase (short-subunit alcohol dehydrogenase family)|nr:SDR family oxidoreductase [Chloroflexota bacterium]MBT3863499.1 SDR family oxidoreductase [Chloroflexota bacterium]MBT4142062.1 SDR family oxidoreductase [Chloroflexota bacterium]MBT4341863.1 SDR family oxidoreductase [Chloroflexota bacterium]MBT4943131.1 SDR family oxidoreductase [Chloroflexota bacterium]|tara:strand:- start:411 stop:1154 length:744 start_codon:yes stop_codon:yes gene_type:complete
MGQLDGKVAIVTGGGSGIGKGIAKAFADEGCSVVIAARNSDRLDAAAAELSNGGGTVISIPTDVTSEEQMISLFAKTMDQFGKLDVLVNNSGAFDGGPVEELTMEQWQKVIDVNVTGPFLGSREAFKIMKKQGGGRIINIGSIAAQKPRHSSSPYTTSKHAVWGLTQSLALEGRDHGIAVSALHPGNVMVERRGDGKSATGRDEGPEPLISTEDMGRTALLMATLPPGSNMLEAIVLPLGQAYLGRG